MFKIEAAYKFLQCGSLRVARPKLHSNVSFIAQHYKNLVSNTYLYPRSFTNPAAEYHKIVLEN